MRAAPARNHGQRSWILLACSVLLAATAGGGLLYLLWSYVPHHAAHFADIGASLPLVTRVAIATAKWSVRLFPIFVVLGVPATAVAVVVLVVVSQKVPSHRVLKTAAIGAFLLAGIEIVACALVIYAVQAAY